MRSRFALTTALALVVGCSSTTTTTEPTSKPGPAIAAPLTPEGQLDMSPVPTPKSLVLVMHSTNPKKTIAAIEKLVSLPVRIEALLLDVTKGASQHLELGDSFDLALALDPSTTDIDDPKFFIAFSVPLADDFKALLDILEKEGEDVEQVGKEVWRVKGKGATGLECEVLAPAGRRARLVCGEGASSYRELGPWLARTLPAEPKPAQDVWMRADFGPVRDVILPKIRAELDKELGDARQELTGVGISDPELLSVPSTVAKELALAIEEVDRIEGGVAIDGTKIEISGAGELFFRGNQAWVTKVLTDGAGKSAPPPDMFWRLPRDADSALFGRASDPALFTGIRRVGKKGIAVGLDFLQRESDGLLKDGDKQAFIGLFDAIPTMRGTWVSASGTLSMLPGGFPAGAKTDTFTPLHAVVETRNKARAIVGWSVVGGEGDPEQMINFLVKGVDSYDRVVKMARQSLDLRAKTAPASLKAHYQKERAEMDRLIPKVKVVKNPAGWPKGSAVLELDVGFSSEDVWTWVHPDQSWDSRKEHPKGRATRGVVPIRVAVAPDEAGRYFWGYGADPDVLKQKMLGSLKGVSPDQTLAARTDLARLKRPMQGGGFLSYGRTFESLAKIDEGDSDMRELLAILGKLPNKGNAPVFFFGGGKGGPQPSVSFEIVFEKPWVQDLSVLVKELAMGTSRSAPPEPAMAVPPPPPPVPPPPPAKRP